MRVSSSSKSRTHFEAAQQRIGKLEAENGRLREVLAETVHWLDRMDFDILSRCGIRRQTVEEVCHRARAELKEEENR